MQTKEVDPNTVTEVLDLVKALVGDKVPAGVRVMLRPIAEKFIGDLLTNSDVSNVVSKIPRIIAAKDAVLAVFED